MEQQTYGLTLSKQWFKSYNGLEKDIQYLPPTLSRQFTSLSNVHTCVPAITYLRRNSNRMAKLRNTVVAWK
jgi:hypothetical protein